MLVELQMTTDLGGWTKSGAISFNALTISSEEYKSAFLDEKLARRANLRVPNNGGIAQLVERLVRNIPGQIRPSFLTRSWLLYHR